MSDPVVTRRGIIAPVADYSDGTTRLALPDIINAPVEAARSLMRPPVHPDELTNEQAADMLLAGLTAAGIPLGGAFATQLIRGFEGSLGAAGGRVTPKDVISWMHRAGVPIERVKQADTGTTYIKFRDPNGPKRPGDATPTVRFPDDGHVGRRPSEAEVGNLFDTATDLSGRVDTRVLKNQSGEKYAEPDALFDALKWRTARSPDGQWLIPPDRAPRGVRSADRAPEPAPERPVLDPDQLKLLAAGDPGAIAAFARIVRPDQSVLSTMFGLSDTGAR